MLTFILDGSYLRDVFFFFVGCGCKIFGIGILDSQSSRSVGQVRKWSDVISNFNRL